MKQKMECIDAGSEYCPCYLSEIGECIMCSQLRGKTFCDCVNWKGVCIYQEYIWNKSRMKEGRKSFLCSILDVENVSESVAIFKIKTTRTLARELNQPGAYVFLRQGDNPSFFDTPMSIMRAHEDEGIIEIAVQVRGVKTKNLTCPSGKILLRGPYWNGLLGLKYIKGLTKEKALLIVRGIAQAPAVPVAGRLTKAGNEVTVILDPGKAEANFAEKDFLACGCKVIHKPLLDGNLLVPEDTLEEIRELLLRERVQLVYSGGNEKLHRQIANLVNQVNKEIFYTCSNDGRFCCGEGVCGSCHERLKDGSRIRTCKTQLSPVEIFGGR